MIIPILLIGACLASSANAAVRPPEERLRILLADIQTKHNKEMRAAVVGSANDLRDAVAKEDGPAKKAMMNRLPGMAADPFNLCRDLAGCSEAPLSLHVEDQSLINDAFIALARPWFNLQKARGKDVAVSVDAGLGIRLKLEDSPRQKAVTLEAAPAATGGFDVSLREGPQAALVYFEERAALLAEKQNPAK